MGLFFPENGLDSTIIAAYLHERMIRRVIQDEDVCIPLDFGFCELEGPVPRSVSDTIGGGAVGSALLSSSTVSASLLVLSLGSGERKPGNRMSSVDGGTTGESWTCSLCST